MIAPAFPFEFQEGHPLGPTDNTRRTQKQITIMLAMHFGYTTDGLPQYINRFKCSDDRGSNT